VRMVEGAGFEPA